MTHLDLPPSQPTTVAYACMLMLRAMMREQYLIRQGIERKRRQRMVREHIDNAALSLPPTLARPARQPTPAARP